MSKTIRIRTTPGGADKYVKMKLDQDFDFIDILSLKISQEEAYKEFCSDYGVIVGRVIANSGFGVPNAKVSIFVPITDEDKDNPVISSVYPYENVFADKDSGGIRYNLLPDSRQSDCHNPVGTFPSKRKVLDNDVILEIFEKYYKYTTTTNHAGDYMIFGVPVGNHILHMDVDLSDIGALSQKPYDFIREGAPEKLFDSTSKFKSSNELDTLAQIKTTNRGVNIVPFWGDLDNCEVGITRVDIPLSHQIQPNSIFIGSLFSDTGNDAINKRCRPQGDVGELCETVSTEGFIEMIRETTDGSVERFDVEGGRVIDDEGAWAYQVPMNLDYRVTDEFGNLIPSEDPNKGIATRANVRFRISMDPTGGDKRNRQRANYLIPNNPPSGQGDYSFDETTSTTTPGVFTEMKWNKLYTVRNYIPRFQTVDRESTRRFLGIKDVDDCGTHTPFPYNRFDTEINPLFSFLCVLTQIIGAIVRVFNFTVIPVINLLVSIVRGIVGAVNNLPGVNINEPNFVPCMMIECDSNKYAPGCTGSNGLDAATDSNGGIEPSTDATLFRNCISTTLAEALDIFEFDFYNDWINGTLFLPMFKIKTRNNGDEKYCEYDCDDFDSNSPNDCDINHIYDRCIGSNIYNKGGIDLKRGLIKESDDTFYYAAKTTGSDIPLLLTDVTLLGSVLDCDIDNIPSMYADLPTTTYRRPPLVNEEDDNGNVLTTGVDPLFMNVSCLGIFQSNSNNCNNVKRICEIGMGFDESDNVSGADTIINNEEIEDSLVRKKLISMNIGSLLSTTDDGFTGTEYNTYRDQTSFSPLTLPMGNSLYFYFGIKPGKTAIEKANAKYFLPCDFTEETTFLISGLTTNVTTISGSDGSIDITIIDGVSPFTYEWKDSSGTVVGTTQDLTGLPAGTYTVKVIDDEGNVNIRTFEVFQPIAMSVSTGTTNVSMNGAADGIITVSALGGASPYDAEILSGPSNVGATVLGFPFSAQFTGLVTGYYTIEVKDSSIPQSSQVLIVFVSEPPLLTVLLSSTDISCNGQNDGTISLSISGGIPPYNVNTTGTSYNSGALNQNNLVGGSYDTIVQDSVGQQVEFTIANANPTILVNPLLLIITLGIVLPDTGGGVGGITVTAVGGTGTRTFTLFNNLGIQVGVTNTTGLFVGLVTDTYSVTVTDINGCEDEITGINV